MQGFIRKGHHSRGLHVWCSRFLHQMLLGLNQVNVWTSTKQKRIIEQRAALRVQAGQSAAAGVNTSGQNSPKLLKTLEKERKKSANIVEKPSCVVVSPSIKKNRSNHCAEIKSRPHFLLDNFVQTEGGVPPEGHQIRFRGKSFDFLDLCPLKQSSLPCTPGAAHHLRLPTNLLWRFCSCEVNYYYYYY